MRTVSALGARARWLERLAPPRPRGDAHGWGVFVRRGAQAPHVLRSDANTWSSVKYQQSTRCEYRKYRLFVFMQRKTTVLVLLL